ncbi:MAG: hypothetical protein ACKVS9_10590 [Phycisphaerae bacterium]
MSYIDGKAPKSLGFTKIIYEKHARQLARAVVTINRPEIYNASDFDTLNGTAAAFLDASHERSSPVLDVERRNWNE